MVVQKLCKVSGRDIPVMIQGETGTGKDLLAKAIHSDSARSSQPFVSVNCASIPDTLIESELFGYEEGAFTGARKKGASGRILQAHGGTLFLDEIGDMPKHLQARLLRVLQERKVSPLGAGKEVDVDVVVISATHKKPERHDCPRRLPRRPVLPPQRPGGEVARTARAHRLRGGDRKNPQKRCANMGSTSRCRPP
jgi:transcriptional regulator with PAS, ATPase and Fis domain